jgi:glycosyltransferase involved in cell wall biosynthesis
MPKERFEAKVVLHVITTINRGGAENHLVELIGGQCSNGWKVTVAFLKGDAYWSAALRSLGVQVIHLSLERYGDLTPWLRLRRLIQALRPAIVHAHLPPAELYARLALLGVRPSPVFLITKHNDKPFFSAPGANGLARWVARGARRIIAISDAVNQYMRERTHIPASMLVTVHYGIDVAPFLGVSEEQRAATRASFGCPSDSMLIGTVARLVPQKGLHILLDGYARYRATANRASRLVLVGAGPLLTPLSQQAESLGIRNHVVFAGFRDDIPYVHAALDLFVLTSVHEGFGLVLLEAMAAGRPILATKVGAIPEVVIDGETGYLVEPRAPEQLASCMQACEDRDRRQIFGHAGRNRAVEVFGLQRMIARTMDIYSACIVSPQ